MGSVSEGDSRIPGQDGVREGHPRRQGLPKQRMFRGDILQFQTCCLCPIWVEIRKWQLVIWAWNTAEKSKLDIFANVC